MTLTVPEILEQIRLNRGRFPREAIESAIRRRAEIVPELLRILDEAADRPAELLSEHARIDHVYALYLLAQFREPAAYPRVIRFFRLPGEVALDLTGDVVTEDLHRILASVCHGDVGLIQQLIEDPEVNEWVRGAAVRALLELVMSGQLRRGEVVANLGELLDGGLEREPSHVWNAVASVATDLHPGETAVGLWRAYQEGLIDPSFISTREIERALNEPQDVVLEDAGRRSKGLIVNIMDEVSWWSCFHQHPRRYQGRPAGSTTRKEGLGETGWAPSQPGHRAAPKVRRNEPCPCGSGKKYKKCCGAHPGAQ